MWSIFPAAAILLAQAQPGPAEKWCFERGQGGAQLLRGHRNGVQRLAENQLRDRYRPVPAHRAERRTIRLDDGTTQLGKADTN